MVSVTIKLVPSVCAEPILNVPLSVTLSVALRSLKVTLLTFAPTSTLS